MNFAKIKQWFLDHNIYSLKFYKNGNRKLKRWLAIFFTSFVSFFLVLAIVITAVAHSYLSLIDRPDDFDHGNINPETDQKFDQVLNIMFYGIDSRDMTEISRSDAIMLVTIDQPNNKIKMTSIARDTRVDIPGYGKDKINHAFANGWVSKGNIAGGAELSVKTINANFDLNVKNYVTANFWALAHIIDYIGGVEVEVYSAERNDINRNYIPHLQQMGIECEKITETGKVQLTGGQAVAYCRVRYVGGTTARGERHQEVLMALFEKAKSLNVAKYPELVSLILKECSTSLSNSQIMSLGSWAVTNLSSLKFETLGIPTAEMDYGETINGVWYHTYDLEKATDLIHKFILENE